MTVAPKTQPRCLYRSPTGRRCRSNASIGWNVCGKHADYGRAYAAAQEIVSNRDRLDTAEGIHTMMTRVARALAAGEVSPRRASALFYGGRAMHFSLRRLTEEREGIFTADEDDVWRDKALADSHHDKLNCEASSENEEVEDGDEQESELAEPKKK